MKYIKFLLLILILLLIYYFKDPIMATIPSLKKEITIPPTNHYALNHNFEYLQITDNFIPTEKQEIKNIIYTFLDHGWDEFTFYCDNHYNTCIEDVKEIAQNESLLSDINNFVHPFNSYNKLYITVNNLGVITIKKDWLYTKEEIESINQKVDAILQELNLENQTELEKIKNIHDYIIDHSVYDSARAELIKNGKKDDIKYPSHKATGPLLSGQALCSGYSDALAIFLNRLQIKNYKIASTNHVWNAIYLNDTWSHIDLTWDDPVVSTNENIRLEEYFMLDTNALEQKDTSQHTFDKNIYIELK